MVNYVFKLKLLPDVSWYNDVGQLITNLAISFERGELLGQCMIV
jgi:hypothetical protein